MPILTNLAIIGLLAWLARFLYDVHKLIRKSITALDRDQDILNQITEIPITNHVDGVEEVAGFEIDLDMDERDATLAFIDQFRAAKRNHDTNGN